MPDNELEIIGLSKQATRLIEVSGISKDYLSEIERGKKIPSLKRLIKIAEAFEIDTYKLLMPIAE